MCSRLLGVACTFVTSLPQLPVVLVGGEDGTLVVVAVRLQRRHGVDGNGNDTHLAAQLHVVAERRIHTQPLRFAVREANGKSLVVVGSDGGHVFLLSTGKERSFVRVLDGAETGSTAVLDAAFSHDTILCLLAAEEDRGGRAGDRICRLAVTYKKELRRVGVIQLGELCSGVTLAANRRAFFAMLEKKKAIAKFNIGEEEVKGTLFFSWILPVLPTGQR